MTLPAKFSSQFRLAGTVTLDACPVCHSSDISMLWVLPQNRLKGTTHLQAPGSDMDGLYLDYLPTLEAPQSLFRFDICADCESIFLNPKEDDHSSYVNDVTKVESYRSKGLDGFRVFARGALERLPEGATRVVDMACGAGQVLQLMREARPDLSYAGLELSRPSVAFLRDELKFEAHAVDLDQDDLDALIPPGSVDLVILQEAYEHVRDPITVLGKAARMLRPGGRLWFTAQYWGDNPLVIRVGEPIYINDTGFEFSMRGAGLQPVELVKDIKIRALLEKPADGAAPAIATPLEFTVKRKKPKPVATGAAKAPPRPKKRRLLGLFRR